MRRAVAPGRWVVDHDPESGLTEHQRRILHVVRSYNGNRCRAARELGLTVQRVQDVMHLAQRAGVRVPPSPAGRRGRPDLRPRTRSA